MAIDSVDGPPELEISDVGHLPEYVTGMPVYLAVTVTAPRNSSFSSLRFANLLDLAGCIGIEIVSTDGKTVVRHVPLPHPFENPEDPGGILGEGESRRMLVDVSTFVPANLHEGQYRARLAYAVSRRKHFWSKPFELKFRNPTKTEAESVAIVAPDRPKALDWADWTYTQPRYAVYTGEIDPENPLKLNLILRRLFFGGESLEEVNPGLLDVLTAGTSAKLYEPETWALKAELYRARGDRARAEQCVQASLRSAPGLGWWTRMIEVGEGFLSTFRLGRSRGR